MSKTPYFVYIVLCANAHCYTGITTDLVRRIDEHNGKRSGGAHYTKVHGPVTLLYSEEHASRSSAQSREYEIKQLTHAEKLALCATKHTA